MRLLQAVAGGILPAVAAWVLGRALLRRLGLMPVVEFAAGAALLSLLILMLFVAHAAWPWVFVGLAVGGCVGAVLLRPQLRLSVPLGVWPVALVYGGLYLTYALTPEIQGDALHYHLWLASQTQTTGTFTESISFYSVLPQGVETLFAFAFSLGGEPAAKLLHLMFLIGCVPLVLSIAERLGYSQAVGWIAVLFFAITPVVGVSATCAYTDAALAFYTLAVCVLLLEWWNAPGVGLALVAGLCGGFCYAIKFTGGWTAAVAFVVIVWRQKWTQAMVFAAGVVLVAGPWILRAAVLTGNPFAPLFNSIFPNPYFHLETVSGLSAYLRDYGGVRWADIPWQLTVRGDVLQGILGPVSLLLPLSLLALRNKRGRILLAAGILAAVPWTFNIGTRFLIPALPFFMLAMMGSVSRAVGVSLLVLHSLASWPSVIQAYAAPGVWALSREIPWRVALGLQDGEAWREERNAELPVAKLIRAHTGERDRVLDLVNLPVAVTGRDLVSVWQSAAGDRILHEMELARTPGLGQFYEWRSRFERKRLGRVRVRFGSGGSRSAAIREVTFVASGVALRPNIVWTIDAWPNVWEAPLAVDRNRVSGWSTWQPVERGMFWGVDFNGAPELTEVRVVADNTALGAKVELWGDEGGWRLLPLPAPQPVPPVNLRLAAMRMARRDGVTFVVAQRGLPGNTEVLGKIGLALEEDPHDWGLEPVGRRDNVVLYRIMTPQ